MQLKYELDFHGEALTITFKERVALVDALTCIEQAIALYKIVDKRACMWRMVEYACALDRFTDADVKGYDWDALADLLYNTPIMTGGKQRYLVDILVAYVGNEQHCPWQLWKEMEVRKKQEFEQSPADAFFAALQPLMALLREHVLDDAFMGKLTEAVMAAKNSDVMADGGQEA